MMPNQTVAISPSAPLFAFFAAFLRELRGQKLFACAGEILRHPFKRK
jgi:hypothetical protein